MASELLHQIEEDFLSCQICQSKYHQPKALPCLHTFCEGCLKDFTVSRNYEQRGHFPCPLCRRQTTIPTEGVENFPDNHLVVSLMDTLQENENRVNALNENRDRPQVTEEVSRDVVPPNRPPPPLCVPVRHNHQGAELSFGRFGLNLMDFYQPVGLAVSGEHIIVSDQIGNRIMIFNWAGKLVNLFICSGKIHCLSLTHRGSLLVANSKAGPALARQYSLNGQHTGSYGNMFEFEKPHGVTSLNKDDEVVVTSTERSTVFIMGKNGKLVQKFGGTSHSDPRHVAASLDQKIIISCHATHCIKIFDKFGKALDRIGGEGKSPGYLKHPLGVCVDRCGNVIVADWGNQRVQVMSMDGEQYKVVVDCRPWSKAPVNVALSPDERKLVVLMVGTNAAEVCVYPYRTLTKRPLKSSVCACS